MRREELCLCSEVTTSINSSNLLTSAINNKSRLCKYYWYIKVSTNKNLWGFRNSGKDLSN